MANYSSITANFYATIAEWDDTQLQVTNPEAMTDKWEYSDGTNEQYGPNLTYATITPLADTDDESKDFYLYLKGFKFEKVPVWSTTGTESYIPPYGAPKLDHVKSISGIGFTLIIGATTTDENNPSVVPAYAYTAPIPECVFGSEVDPRAAGTGWYFVDQGGYQQPEYTAIQFYNFSPSSMQDSSELALKILSAGDDFGIRIPLRRLFNKSDYPGRSAPRYFVAGARMYISYVPVSNYIHLNLFGRCMAYFYPTVNSNEGTDASNKRFNSPIELPAGKHFELMIPLYNSDPSAKQSLKVFKNGKQVPYKTVHTYNSIDDELVDLYPDTGSPAFYHGVAEDPITYLTVKFEHESNEMHVYAYTKIEGHWQEVTNPESIILPDEKYRKE